MRVKRHTAVRQVLNDTRGIFLNADYEQNLSSERLSFVDIVAMSPLERRSGGKYLHIGYSFTETPFGTVLAASTPKGLCHLSFADEGESEALGRLKSEFPNAVYTRSTDPHQLNALSVFSDQGIDSLPVTLHVKGTPFQVKVWQTLLKIPVGGLVTYSDLASKAGFPKACRAVGTAVGKNPVMILIPCHRVVRASGQTGKYRYGADRKKSIIGWEVRGPSSAK